MNSRSIPILAFSAALTSVVFAAEPPVAGDRPVELAMARAASTAWGDAPPSLPAGAQAAVLSGDPGAAGAFAIRLKAPAGWRVPRHAHPMDEQVTVIEGDLTLSMGAGDRGPSLAFGPGDYVNLPANQPHEASTRGGAVIQIQANGPFEIHYTDPGDDPRGTGPREPGGAP